MKITKAQLVSLFSFATLIPTLWGGSVNVKFDDIWKQCAKQARKKTLAAYELSPENVTSNLNYNVNK